MKKRLAILATAALIGLATAAPASALQCVPYARQASGIDLRGDAWTWWDGASGQYDRGQAPRTGAVMVFKRHGSMRHGHVAVVSRVVTSREVLVDHANWAPYRGSGRGKITTQVRVVDTSPKNDWTQVRVWNNTVDDLGSKTYPTYGFIYSRSTSRMAQASMPASAPRALDQVVSDGRGHAVEDVAVQPAPQSTPIKPEPIKTAEVKPAETKPEAKPEQVAAVPAPKAEEPKAEPAKVETAKAEPAKLETGKADVKAESKPVQVAAVTPRKPAKAQKDPAKADAHPSAAPKAEAHKAEEVWEGDEAAALRAGAGRYSFR